MESRFEALSREIGRKIIEDSPTDLMGSLKGEECCSEYCLDKLSRLSRRTFETPFQTCPLYPGQLSNPNCCCANHQNPDRKRWPWKPPSISSFPSSASPCLGRGGGRSAPPPYHHAMIIQLFYNDHDILCASLFPCRGRAPTSHLEKWFCIIIVTLVLVVSQQSFFNADY